MLPAQAFVTAAPLQRSAFARTAWQQACFFLVALAVAMVAIYDINLHFLHDEIQVYEENMPLENMPLVLSPVKRLVGLTIANPREGSCQACGCGIRIPSAARRGSVRLVYLKLFKAGSESVKLSILLSAPAWEPRADKEAIDDWWTCTNAPPTSHRAVKEWIVAGGSREGLAQNCVSEKAREMLRVYILLREPVQQAISAVYYFAFLNKHTKGRIVDGEDAPCAALLKPSELRFEQFVSCADAFPTIKRHTGMTISPLHQALDVLSILRSGEKERAKQINRTQADLDRALHTLQHEMFGVGVMERMGESMLLLSAQLGVAPADFPLVHQVHGAADLWANATGVTDGRLVDHIPQQTLRDLRAALSFDTLLYNAANKLLDKHIAEEVQGNWHKAHLRYTSKECAVYHEACTHKENRKWQDGSKTPFPSGYTIPCEPSL